MDNQNIIFNAIASLEMADLHPSAFDREIAVRLVQDEVEIDTVIDALISRYKVES